MDKRKIILSGLLFFILCGCEDRSSRNEKNQNEFYTVTGGWDWIRVPLIKPYQAIKVDPEVETNGWGIKLYSNLYQIDKAKRIDVKDSIIYVLSGKVDGKEDFTAIGTYNLPTAWFILDTRQKTENGFASEAEFRQYIKKNNYFLPQWHDIDSLSKALGEGGKVPWMPK